MTELASIMRKLLMIDDRPVLRVGIQAIIEESAVADCEVHPAPTCLAMTRLNQGDWTAVIVGIATANDSGMRLLRRIKQCDDAPPVLAFIGLPESFYGTRILRLGATGILQDSAPEKDLIRAIEMTLSGRRYISHTLAEQIVTQVTGIGSNAMDEVPLREAIASDEQLQVVRMVALGRPLTHISQALNITPEHVNAHRVDILRRARLADEHELTFYAFEQKLVPDRRAGRQASAEPPLHQCQVFSQGTVAPGFARPCPSDHPPFQKKSS
jgi:DNA-binding NarL/FixJ family response regulator